MTREDIIRMAREAGGGLESDHTNISALQRFATLVAAAERNRTWTQAHWTEYERSIAAAEREACAAVLERGVDLSGLNSEPTLQKFAVDLLMNCADAIRARGEK